MQKILQLALAIALIALMVINPLSSGLAFAATAEVDSSAYISKLLLEEDEEGPYLVNQAYTSNAELWHDKPDISQIIIDAPLEQWYYNIINQDINTGFATKAIWIDAFQPVVLDFDPTTQGQLPITFSSRVSFDAEAVPTFPEVPEKPEFVQHVLFNNKVVRRHFISPAHFDLDLRVTIDEYYFDEVITEQLFRDDLLRLSKDRRIEVIRLEAPKTVTLNYDAAAIIEAEGIEVVVSERVILPDDATPEPSPTVIPTDTPVPTVAPTATPEPTKVPDTPTFEQEIFLPIIVK